MPIFDRTIWNGDKLPRLLYPEAGIEYAFALKSQGRLKDIEFARMLGYCKGLIESRDFELREPLGENPLPYERPPPYQITQN